MTHPDNGYFGSHYIDTGDYFVDEDGYRLSLGFRNLRNRRWTNRYMTSPLLMPLAGRRSGNVLENMASEARNHPVSITLLHWILYCMGAYVVQGEDRPIRYTGMFKTADGSLGFWYRIVRIGDSRAPEILGGSGVNLHAIPVRADFSDSLPGRNGRWGDSWQNTVR